MERRTAARRNEAAELRDYSGEAFRAAAKADRAVLETEYEVRVPYALLCIDTKRGTGKGWRKAHLDSTQYATYNVTHGSGHGQGGAHTSV